ncbi:ArsR/SmtB family transcription factor [Streptomyces phaeochromogenes]|uniref:Metalloregulator ArsR/SmtB family transcription factor n=1 Tax=Streptomyces phaeochromogenes TaxID=1923 RepID=A0ABZ1H5H8_STRPH|nr:metalloregulator ArsR/SmtB family transcription factor [Streptomyces phaeochromogenes]WSD13812.1 metalloregulator ArsR/SmtB family transcription factor [Streptomyces phaeochromogenes]WSJ08727.1 metalloregulator ArsR/SmtB family transcription factor [Streptomyces phaeochromogenes]
MSHEVADPGDDVACFQLSAADAVWWASVFKTLGDPVRLQLLVHLAALGGAEVAAHDICDVGVAQSTVSHHLKRLRDMGLVENRREGRIVYYRMGAGVRSALMQILHQRDSADAPMISSIPEAQNSGPLSP